MGALRWIQNNQGGWKRCKTLIGISYHTIFLLLKNVLKEHLSSWHPPKYLPSLHLQGCLNGWNKNNVVWLLIKEQCLLGHHTSLAKTSVMPTLVACLFADSPNVIRVTDETYVCVTVSHPLINMIISAEEMLMSHHKHCRGEKRWFISFRATENQYMSTFEIYISNNVHWIPCSVVALVILLMITEVPSIL